MHNDREHFSRSLLLYFILLQACGLHNQVANDLGTLTERQIYRIAGIFRGLKFSRISRFLLK